MVLSRREWLEVSGGGFKAMPLAWMLNQEAIGAPDDPLGPKRMTRRGQATSVIFLFMEGGPSHLDLFDPKPELRRFSGQPLPESVKRVITAMGEQESPLLADKRVWKQHGECGTWVSDWLPHTAECVDDIAVIRSCWTNGINHSGGVCQMNTGIPTGGRPSLGAWVTYGLGTENQSLPAFVVMRDNTTQVVNGPRNWGTGFMPAVYQGTTIDTGDEPVPNLTPSRRTSESRQRAKLSFLRQINSRFAAERPQETELEARIRSYELAFRLQSAAPEAVDLAAETEETQELYGIRNKPTERFGRMCLLARRLVERGVRFIQLYHGSGSKWDAHSGIEKNHSSMCAGSDRPVAGLLQDLKRRGLLENTLVVWGGEFGRTPMSEKGDGRDHNPSGFTMWMAGGGVQGGRVIGTTDDFGLHAVDDRLHVHDLHATILHLMGVDHRQLVFMHKGRPERIDVNEGVAFEKITG